MAGLINAGLWSPHIDSLITAADIPRDPGDEYYAVTSTLETLQVTFSFVVSFFLDFFKFLSVSSILLSRHIPR